jgi:hypothetical protein
MHIITLNCNLPWQFAIAAAASRMLLEATTADGVIDEDKLPPLATNEDGSYRSLQASTAASSCSIYLLR